MAKQRFSKATVAAALRATIERVMEQHHFDPKNGYAQLLPPQGQTYCSMDTLIERAMDYGAMRLAERLMHQLEFGDA